MNAATQIASIAQTAADMIEAGTLNADNIDWNALQAAHIARLEATFQAAEHYISRSIWERANAS